MYLPTATGSDHYEPLYVIADPSRLTATQNFEETHDTPYSFCAWRVAGEDQVDPSYVTAYPCQFTAAQNRFDGHDTADRASVLV
jgi:hypothetical protein